MGIGKTNLPGEGAEEVWSRLEDFRWGQEFDEFLRYIDRESASNTTLVILGDALELWQSSDALCTGTGTSLKCKVNDCEHGSVKVGCTVEEAKRRVQHVVKEHKDVFDSLGAFTKKGRNHLVIVPGNHDAALMLPAVRDIIIRAISGAPNDAVTVDARGYWVSTDGLVWGEHGHQFDKVNSFEGWPNPVVNGTTYLQRPWGEALVQDFYNQYEVLFPIVDNMTSELTGVKLAIASGGFDDVAIALQKFATFLLTKNSREQFIAVLATDDASTLTGVASRRWAIGLLRTNNGIVGDAERPDELGPTFVANSFVDEKMRSIALRGIQDGQFTLSPADLDDLALEGLCDARAVRAKAENNESLQCPTITGGGSLGYVKDKILGRDESLIRLSNLH